MPLVGNDIMNGFIFFPYNSLYFLKYFKNSLKRLLLYHISSFSLKHFCMRGDLIWLNLKLIPCILDVIVVSHHPE